VKPIPQDTARLIAMSAGATRVAILYLDGQDFGVTTWGNTVQDVRALSSWACGDGILETVAQLGLDPAERRMQDVAQDADFDDSEDVALAFIRGVAAACVSNELTDYQAAMILRKQGIGLHQLERARVDKGTQAALRVALALAS